MPGFFDVSGGRGQTAIQAASHFSKGASDKEALRLARAEAILKEKEVGNFENEFELEQYKVAQKDTELGINERNARVNEREATVAEANAQTNKDKAAVDAKQYELEYDKFHNEITEKGTENDKRQVEIFEKAHTMAADVYDNVLEATGDEEKARSAAASITDQFAGMLEDNLKVPFRPEVSNAVRARVKKGGDKGQQHVNLVDRRTRKGVLASFDPETGGYLVDGKPVSNDDYEPMPGQTGLADTGPTRTQITEIQLATDTLQNGLDLIQTVTKDPSLLGITGTSKRGVEDIFGIGGDILRMAAPEFVNPLRARAESTAAAMMIDSNVDEGTKKIVGRIFDKQINQTEAIELSLALAYAQAQYTDGRIPVEVIKRSQQMVQLTGLKSGQAVQDKFDFIQKEFANRISSFNKILKNNAESPVVKPADGSGFTAPEKPLGEWTEEELDAFIKANE